MKNAPLEEGTLARLTITQNAQGELSAHWKTSKETAVVLPGSVRELVLHLLLCFDTAKRILGEARFERLSEAQLELIAVGRLEACEIEGQFLLVPPAMPPAARAVMAKLVAKQGGNLGVAERVPLQVQELELDAIPRTNPFKPQCGNPLCPECHPPAEVN